MTDLHQTANDRVTPEPSVPASHDSIEFTEGSVVVYDRENTERWIWADEAVHCDDMR